MTSPINLPLPEAKPISIRNAWVARLLVRAYSDASGQWPPLASMDDLRVRFSADPTGYDDSGYPTTILGPYVMSPTSQPGEFARAITADQVMGALADLVGQTVYQVWEGDYGTSYYNLSAVQPLVVVDPRSPIP